jgi:2-oxoacid:acceptor oxidoreductase gamma subunit (pyruvate/2-ketoisovalerate family)
LYRIKFFGLGGQGVVTAAKILCHAIFIYEDKFARNFPAFGQERRGALVFSDVIIDSEPILINSFVYTPDFVIVLAQDIIDKGVNIGKGIHDNSTLVINTEAIGIINRIKKKYNFVKIHYVNATKIATEQMGSNITGGAILGAFAKTGVVKIDSICKSLTDYFKDDIGEKNAKAAQEAYNKLKTI